ncbi:MAG: sulfurtransferase TusA family protein [Lachnospiraceae bacterium]|nr:sulfurtransferase TusA family protein [Lachnospiraceae bacterium]MDY5742020.1 sulfurtransferase TusA family protein [Lachnospiraceae bacterium]
MIDARGRSCPEPVMMLKQALKSAESSYEVWVDCKAALENVSRYGEEHGYRAAVEEKEDMYVIRLTK